MQLFVRHSQFRLFGGVFLALMLGLATSPALAQQSLRISDETAAGTNPVAVDVLADLDADTEGFVLSVSYPTDDITVSDVRVDGTETGDVGAELIVAEVMDDTGGFTLGIVLDSSPPFDGQTIAATAGDEEVVIARFDVAADVAVDATTTVDITFEDGLNDPPLDNILVQGGFSVSIGPDLEVIDGVLTLEPAPPLTLYIGDAETDESGLAVVEISMDNASDDVQAFVLSIEHDAGLEVEEVNIDGTVTDAAGAEFVVPVIEDGGATLAVVLDVEAPLEGQVISAGTDQHIANYVMSCTDRPVDPEPAEVFEMRFVNGVFGDPLLDNVIVVDGSSIDPTIIDAGNVTCTPGPPPPVENTDFYCGTMNEDGEIVDVIGAPGQEATISLFFTDPDSNIQGFQVAMCFNDFLVPVDGSFTVEGTILDAIGAEFVNVSYDVSTTDGDGIEMHAAVLLDALPPYEDQMTPITVEPLEFARFNVMVSEDAVCDECYTIEFCNGIDAAETREVDNLVVIDYESRPGVGLNNCAVCIAPGTRFVRGDCNNDGRCDLADPATSLGKQFQGILVECEDACDANDDGKADLADSIYLLTFLFNSGPDPLAPYPMAGLDPTDDNLTCENGQLMCP